MFAVGYFQGCARGYMFVASGKIPNASFKVGPEAMSFFLKWHILGIFWQPVLSTDAMMIECLRVAIFKVAPQTFAII
jgi:hypothetical protein